MRMWNKFLQWHRENDLQVRWFFVGVFTVLFLRDVSAGDWLSALVDAILIYLNVWTFNDRRGS